MPDREKVIKGLECCYASFPTLKGCSVCPYVKICYHDKACDELLRDALSMLKEQEAVKPTWNRGKPFCGACGLRIYGGKFCSECGKPVLWEGR